MISVIIPVYNEEHILSEQLNFFKKLSNKAELIFVDGGSKDNTVQLIEPLGRVIAAEKGRAGQMNAGAKHASHEIFLFLHADTYLPIESLGTIEQEILSNDYAGGCLRQVIDEPGLLFRWIAWTGNLRAKLFKIFYGDQGIFVRRDVFEQMGGFPDAKLAEDVLFTQNLRKNRKTGVLPNPIYCSARRWTHQGIVKTFLVNARISFGLMRHSNVDHLSNLYQDIR